MLVISLSLMLLLSLMLVEILAKAESTNFFSSFVKNSHLPSSKKIKSYKINPHNDDYRSQTNSLRISYQILVKREKDLNLLSWAQQYLSNDKVKSIPSADSRKSH
ncbi:hypothetical protein WICMUC_004776 [Wickerhamomyces mucosus]|uniref:Uncharacterized protein n=1 Tax=Wickerhamomyces mucosus TaxID=1378264 RepID=A0A9P8TAB9_9ASCO|nr:hypothetical protein WICMUC_004776 [Wickerhamomyces mucosus]